MSIYIYNWRKGGRIRGPFRGQKVCKGGGCPDVGVRGSGVEGGLRPVPRGRPAKKKQRFLFNLGEKGKMIEKDLLLNLLYP